MVDPLQTSRKRKQIRLNFWQKADRFPPVLVRLLARHPKGRPLTVPEIAGRSGLSHWQIESLSRLTSWDAVDLHSMRRFLTGCGLDFERLDAMHRVNEYLRERQLPGGAIKRPNFKYLRTSPDWSSIYSPLMSIYLQHVATNQPQTTDH